MEILLYKIFIIIFIITIFIIYKDFSKDFKNEKEIIRYIKYKRRNNITKYYFEKEIPKIKKYVELLRKGYFENKIYYYNILKPKISFIATVYNKEKYLIPFISSIQNQNLKEFELIVVDDYSTDKSVEIINNLQEKDRRILLIKNKRNRGSLYSRYRGALYSKGKYIIFVDSDDIILKEGILNSYNYIKKKNLDMIEFNSVFELNDTTTFINRRYYKYINIIYQPILSYIFYYKEKNGYEDNTALWDKLIKREVVLKSLEFIGTKMLNKNIIIENDVIILFSLFKNSENFQYIDELGYYYFFKNNDSITNIKRSEPERANKIIYSIFSNIDFLYDKTDNSFLGKYFCLFKLIQGYKRYKNCFQYSYNHTFYLIIKVLNKLFESDYITQKDKIMIKNISIGINKNKTWII